MTLRHFKLSNKEVFSVQWRLHFLIYLFTYLLYYQLKYLKHSVGFCLFQLKPHSWAPLHISNTVSCILLVRGDVEQWNQTRPSKYHRGKDYFTSTKDKICVWIIIIGCLGANCHTRHFLWAGTVSGGLLHLKRCSLLICPPSSLPYMSTPQMSNWWIISTASGRFVAH